MLNKSIKIAIKHDHFVDGVLVMLPSRFARYGHSMACFPAPLR
jgi:hypothetical protein